MSRKRAKRIVAMICMPGRIERGRDVRSGTDYAKYGQATWRWWCKKNNIDFIVLDQRLGGNAYDFMPPTIHRWLAPALLIHKYGPSTRVALVDADTMIRWDTPNFFDLAESHFAAVLDKPNNPWVERSIAAYQTLFPGVHLSPSYYFNAGFVILGEQQLNTVTRFTEFTKERWSELHAVQTSGNFGSDQTPLNLFLCREREPICFLPWAFNRLHCGHSATGALQSLIMQAESITPEMVTHTLESTPNVFDFINFGYIWHFTALYQFRSDLMRATWHRVRKHYHRWNFLDHR